MIVKDPTGYPYGHAMDVNMPFNTQYLLVESWCQSKFCSPVFHSSLDATLLSSQVLQSHHPLVSADSVWWAAQCKPEGSGL